jgi:hypothetical protein
VNASKKSGRGYTTRISALRGGVASPPASSQPRRDAARAEPAPDDFELDPPMSAPASQEMRKSSSVEVRTPPGARGRPSFVAVSSFVSASCGPMQRTDLARWIDESTPSAGVLAAHDGRLRRSVQEPGAGATALHGAGRDEPFGEIVALARDRVLEAARGLVAQPARDGFLVAALVTGRVRRDSSRGGYTAIPRPGDALSDIVLALLAADVLAHRGDYEANLCVCDVCGAMSLDGGDDRQRCDAHATR